MKFFMVEFVAPVFVRLVEFGLVKNEMVVLDEVCVEPEMEERSLSKILFLIEFHFNVVGQKRTVIKLEDILLFFSFFYSSVFVLVTKDRFSILVD